MLDSEKKLSPSDYQTYKLQTNWKDKKLAVYNPVLKYYKMGTPEEWLQFMEAIMQVIKGQDVQDGDGTYLLVKNLLKGDALQVFQNKEESQEVKDSPAFTKCLAAVTKHIFPQKLNDYLVHFPVPDGVTATKISCKDFVDVLEDRIPYQWKLEFKKEGFDSSFSRLKEFLDVCVRLEEAKLQKLLRKL
eukprot:10779301-Ditylum_brightwellii.AAC.1